MLQDLLEYYQKFERPVANEAEAVQLKFGLTLQQIMDVVSVYGEGFKDLKKRYMEFPGTLSAHKPLNEPLLLN